MAAATLALVESSTQLLNVVELAHASDSVAATRVIVLAPRDWQPVRQILATSELARAAGLDVQVRRVRSRGVGGARHLAAIVAETARADHLVIGDPFSGYIQTLLPWARTEHLTVVDDGTATWEYASCVEQGAPLIRWNRPSEHPRERAMRATRVLTPAAGRQMDVFTCLEQAVPFGARRLVNDYAWTRSRFEPVVVAGQLDVLGVSLVDNGVVDRACYVQAVAALARSTRHVRYLPHRRESDDLVAQIAALPGVFVERPELPVELELRRGPVAARVVSFPSTAAHTLPMVLRGAGAHLEVQEILPSWFTPDATEHMRSFVGRIGRRPALPTPA